MFNEYYGHSGAVFTKHTNHTFPHCTGNEPAQEVCTSSSLSSYNTARCVTGCRVFRRIWRSAVIFPKIRAWLCDTLDFSLFMINRSSICVTSVTQWGESMCIVSMYTWHPKSFQSNIFPQRKPNLEIFPLICYKLTVMASPFHCRRCFLLSPAN